MHFYVALNFNVGLYRQHEDKRKSDFSILEYKKSCYVFAVTYYTLYQKKVRAFTGVLITFNYWSIRFRDINDNVEGDMNQTVFDFIV